MPYYGRVPFGRVSSERLSALPCAAMIVANDPYALPVLAEAIGPLNWEVRLVRQAKGRRLNLAGPAVRLDRYEDDLKAGSAGHGPVRLLASVAEAGLPYIYSGFCYPI